MTRTCYSFQLFDVVYREETLLNVMKSVTRNGRSILLTALFAIILVYLFSIIGFIFFKDDFLLDAEGLEQEEQGDEKTESCHIDRCDTAVDVSGRYHTPWIDEYIHRTILAVHRSSPSTCSRGQGALLRLSPNVHCDHTESSEFGLSTMSLITRCHIDKYICIGSSQRWWYWWRVESAFQPRVSLPCESDLRHVLLLRRDHYRPESYLWRHYRHLRRSEIWETAEGRSHQELVLHLW